MYELPPKGDVCTAQKEHCCFCFAVLRASMGLSAIPQADIPDAELNVPVFVSWYLENDAAPQGKQLRGCIGTFEPHPLSQALQVYTIQSAWNDKRFEPIRPAELENLQCTVSLLTPFEECKDLFDWEMGVHGVYVSFVMPVGGQAMSTTATFLPEIAPAQGWSKQETIVHAILKAGWSGQITDSFMRNVRLWRYKSTTATATYKDFVASPLHV